jgi:hypothetical protein
MYHCPLNIWRLCKFFLWSLIFTISMWYHDADLSSLLLYTYPLSGKFRSIHYCSNLLRSHRVYGDVVPCRIQEVENLTKIIMCKYLDSPSWFEDFNPFFTVLKSWGPTRDITNVTIYVFSFPIFAICSSTSTVSAVALQLVMFHWFDKFKEH